MKSVRLISKQIDRFTKFTLLSELFLKKILHTEAFRNQTLPNAPASVVTPDVDIYIVYIKYIISMKQKNR